LSFGFGVFLPDPIEQLRGDRSKNGGRHGHDDKNENLLRWHG
jgi:hypothetical protein